MSTFAAPNRAENISVADAADTLAKLSKLGLYFGPIHACESSGGPEATNIVPLEEIEDKTELMNLQSFSAGTWHNIAFLKRTFGNGGTEGFKRVYNVLYVGADATPAIFNIPGLSQAVEKFIQKATA